MNTFALLLALAPAPQVASVVPAAPAAPVAPVAPVAAVAPVAPVAPVAAVAPAAPAQGWAPASVAAAPEWRYASTSAQEVPGDLQSAEAALREAELRLEAAHRRLAELQREESRAARSAAGGAGPNSTAPMRELLRAERGAVAQRRALEHDIHTELRRALEAAQGGPVPREELERLLRGSHMETRELAVAAQRAAEGEAARSGASGTASTKVWIDGHEVDLSGKNIVRLQQGEPLVLRAKGLRFPRAEGQHANDASPEGSGDFYLGAPPKAAAGGGGPVSEGTQEIFLERGLQVRRNRSVEQEGADAVLRFVPRTGLTPDSSASISVESVTVDAAPLETVTVETEVVDGAKKSLVFRVRTEDNEEFVELAEGGEHEVEVFVSPRGAAGLRTAVPATPSAPRSASRSTSPSAAASVDTSDETLARVLESLSSELAALRRDLDDLRSRVEQR